jgi:hypothetical protein
MGLERFGAACASGRAGDHTVTLRAPRYEVATTVNRRARVCASGMH